MTALGVGNPGHAEEILDRAFREDPDPALLYLLGLVAQAQGRPVAALDLYRRYQEIVGPAIPAENQTDIETFAASMTAPVTAINVTASVDGLLCVDDKIAGLLPLRTPVLIGGGTHRFRIERNKQHYETGQISIPDGREAELRLTPGSKGQVVALLSLAPITMFVLAPDPLPGATAHAVQKAAAEAARQNHLAPLPASRLKLHLSKRAPGCLQERDCWFAVAEQAQARSVLQLTVQADPANPSGGDAAVAPFARCQVTVQYFDVNAGQPAARGSTTPTTCGGTELRDAISAVLQTLQMEANAWTRGMVSVSSVPEGAEVRVDGLLRGVTPYLHASFSGSHVVSVDSENYHRFRTQVDVIKGQVASIQAALEPMPADVPEPPPSALRVPIPVWVNHRLPRPRIRLALGGSLLGGGTLLLSFAISALARNNQCALPQDTGELCAANYATSEVGAGLLAGALAFSAAGAVLIAVPGRRERIRQEVWVDPIQRHSTTESEE